MKKTYNSPTSKVVALQADFGLMLALSDTKKSGNEALSNQQNFAPTGWSSENWAGSDED